MTVKTGAKFDDYQKVYLLPSEGDPRAVTPRISSRLSKSGFEVVVLKSDGPPLDAQGTGFVVTPEGHILTCAHVLEGYTNATVWIGDIRHVCRVITADTNLDLALIKIEGSNASFQPLTFTRAEQHMGQDAFVIGFPLVELLGTAPRLNKGLISSTVGLEGSTNQIQISAEVQAGSSGGPLLNDRGEVMGIVSSTLNPLHVLKRTGGSLPQNVNFAIRQRVVRAFLATNQITPLNGSDEKMADAFDRTKQSLALIRGGIVTEEDLKQPTLLCVFGYLSFWDLFYRFRVFQIEFFDMKSGDSLLKAGHYRDDLVSSEDAVLDRVFKEINGNFYPDRPNPFVKTKK